MLNLPPGAKFLLSEQPINISRSFDGLVGLVRNVLKAEPLTPTFFIFLNKHRDKIKILYWDNDGFVIWYKRLEKGTFRIPLHVETDGAIHLTRAQLAMLLEGVDFENAHQRKRFSKKIA